MFSHRFLRNSNKVELYTPKSDLHTNAAFTEAEEFAFMLGEKVTVGVPARSTWVEAAVWDAQSQVITLTTDEGREIPCHGMGEVQARLFTQATSKGAFYWAIVRGRATSGAFPTSTAGFGQAGTATPVAKKIVRKPQAARKWYGWW
jgi:hypothetical protein